MLFIWLFLAKMIAFKRDDIVQETANKMTSMICQYEAGK